MAKYRQVRKLTKERSAYLAGIVDGEGTITLTRKDKTQYRQLAVTISSCELSLVEHILAVVGAGNISKKRVYSPKHSEAYTYGLLNRQALTLLTHVYPFLRTYKRKRAALVLKYYLRLTPRNGKYSVVQLAKRELFIEKFFSLLPHNTKTR